MEKKRTCNSVKGLFMEIGLKMVTTVSSEWHTME